MLNKKLEDLFLSGNNIILTGQAGTGKTWNINKLIEKYSNKKTFALCATTGIAAQLIGGQTLHSFLNLGLLRSNDFETEWKRIVYNKWAKWELVEIADVIIIDEASMMDGFLMDIMDKVLRKILKIGEPFGGKQIILSFDIYQLPPVEVEKNGFFFQSKSFVNANFKSIYLKKIYRQTDINFIECLNRVRLAQHTDTDIKYLSKREFPDLDYSKLDTTCLYSTNEEAERLNTHKLNKINEELEIFYAMDKNHNPQLKLDPAPKFIKDYSKNLRAPLELNLKKGARVILLSNLDVEGGLCNGKIGHYIERDGQHLIVDFDGQKTKIERVKFEVYEQNTLMYERSQYPLILGFACTIHKSQGMSLDSVAIDFKRTFAPHQSYVALSRCRSYEGLYLRNFTSKSIFINPLVKQFDDFLDIE